MSGSAKKLTTKVNVRCSFCNEIVTVPFRHGAVLIDLDADQGVHVFVPRLDGGDHSCPWRIGRTWRPNQASFLP